MSVYGSGYYGAGYYGGSTPLGPITPSFPLWPQVSQQLNHTADPNDPNASNTWTEQAGRVTAFTTKRGRLDELTDVSTGTCTWDLLNEDGRYDPANPASPYYPFLLPYRQIRSQATWGSNALVRPAFEGPSTTGWSATGTGASLTPTPNTVQVEFGASGSGYVGKVATSSGSTQTITVTTPQATAIVGDSWAGMAWVLPQAGSPATVTMEYLNGSGSVLLSSAGVSVSQSAAGGFGQALTAPLVAPSGTAKVRLKIVIPGLTSSLPAYIGCVMAAKATTPLKWYDPGAFVYPLFYGYEEAGWPQSYATHGARSVLRASFVDAFAPLAKITLDQVPILAALGDGATGVWPLSEAGTGGVALDVSGSVARPLLPLTVSGGSVDFGATGVVPAMGNSTAVTLSIVAPTSVVSCIAQLSGSVTAPVPAGQGVSAEVWLSTTTPPASQWAQFMSLAGGAANVHVDSAGKATAVMLGGTTGAAFGPITDGLPHHLAMVVDDTAQNLFVYYDGVLASTASRSGAFGSPGGGITLGLSHGGTFTAETVTVGLVTFTPTTLTPTQVANHYHAGYDGFRGDSVGQRCNRVLDYAAWKVLGLRRIDTVSAGDLDTPLQGALNYTSTTTALDALKEAVNAALGNLDISPSGQIRYRSRDYRYVETTPAWVFGDRSDFGELPYEDDSGFVAEQPPNFLYSAVTVEQRGGINVVRVDDASALKFFPRVLDKSDVALLDPVQCIDMADHLLNAYKTPTRRVKTVVFKPSANPNLWPMCLSIDLGQRVRVWKRPKFGAPAYSIDCYVEAVEHSVTGSPREWKTTLTLSPVFGQQPWILGDPVYGVLGSSTRCVF